MGLVTFNDSDILPSDAFFIHMEIKFFCVLIVSLQAFRAAAAAAVGVAAVGVAATP